MSLKIGADKLYQVWNIYIIKELLTEISKFGLFIYLFVTIQSANILVFMTGMFTVKNLFIADFGISRELQENQMAHTFAGKLFLTK
jgi:hypothetical protein